MTAANSVSRHGKHHIAEVWRYQKLYLSGRGYIYDYEEPLAWDVEDTIALREYVLKVLDALELKNGLAHTELIMTRRGPILLESGACLAGSILPDVVSRCFGSNHVELTAEAFVDFERFAARCSEPYRLYKCVRYVSLIVPHLGIVRADGLEAIRQLRSCAGMMFSSAPGAVLSPTIDSRTSPGVVYLVADAPEQLARDYARLRQIERRELYLECD